MHTGSLLADGQKMSKSLHNFITVDDFLVKHSPKTLRLMILMNHYRSPFNFKEEIAEQANNSWKRIQNFIYRLYGIKSKIPARGGQKSKISELINSAEKDFHSAMEDDFNTPKALAAIFELINKAEIIIKQLNSGDAKKIAWFMLETLNSIGFKPDKKLKIPSQIDKKIKERELLRKNKQFIQSDALRKEIEKLGYIIEDASTGPMVFKK